jgi:8-oxo-dGTP diphosphatase
MSDRVQLDVAAGVIRDPAKGQVLIARRPEGVHQGGLWEFPGGKIERGETVVQALARELQEEVGIDIHDALPLIALVHDYPDRTVRLFVMDVLGFSGDPYGVEGQEVRWVHPDELDQYDFPAANEAIRRAVQLPHAYPILNLEDHSQDAITGILASWQRKGLSLIRLRTRPEFSDERMLAACVRQAKDFRIRVLVDGDLGRAERVEAAGIHLRANQLRAYSSRPVPKHVWLAASCHDLDDLEDAKRIQVDFAVLGSVLPTLSHPGAPHIGWTHFETLVASASFPVYALGGVDLSDLAQAKAFGAQGVAAIRAFLPATPGKGA